MTVPTRRLGEGGPEVSVAGLGCNNFGRRGATITQEGTTAVLNAAIEEGVTLLDTADMYGGEFGLSERLMGVALRGKRDRVIIATKFGHEAVETGLADGAPKGSRAYIRAAVEGSLSRLQTDYLDLYQLHTPDPLTPLEETIAALEELVLEGRIRYYGSSQFDAALVRTAHETAQRLGARGFVSTQNEYHLLSRGAEAELLPTAAELGVGFLPFFPLNNGLFTGKYSRNAMPEGSRIAQYRPQIAEEAPWDALEEFDRFCQERGITMLEATFGWLLSLPALTSVIAGATTPDQVRSNAAAAGEWTPTEGDRAEIDRIFAT